MLVYFTTVLRAAPVEQGGELVKLDWDRKIVLEKVPIVPSSPPVNDPNPRGGTRGGRGILLDNGHVYVASYHSIHVFDSRLQPVQTITHGLLAGLHELAWDGQDIWATSTTFDAAIKVDRSARLVDSWWAREDPVTVNHFNLTPFHIDKAKDNRLFLVGVSDKGPGHVHLNAVAVLDGRPIILLNKLGCVVALRPTQILIHDAGLTGAHNLLVTPDRRIMINDSQREAVVVYDASGRLVKRIEFAQYSPVRRIRRRHVVRTQVNRIARRLLPGWLHKSLMANVIISKPVFVRGLCATNRGTVLVGISPATILEIDCDSEKLVDLYCYSDNVNVCVHGLAGA